ncbi:MAG: cyclic nucleotide-binding domain-containing protein [Deltaproteobacteria bacterium]|nr:cyclic nucleotide-binding domain-containing protein [Deltaproteobacteria bacterium]
MRPAPVRAEVLGRTEAFSGLTEADLRTLAACVRGVRYDPGEIVFREGDPGATLILLAGGTLVATVRGRDGAVRTLHRMSEAEVVGEMAFLDPGPRSATVTAETEAVAYELSHDTMDVLRQRSPAVVGAIVTAVIRDVTRRLRSLDERIAAEIDRHDAEGAP